MIILLCMKTKPKYGTVRISSYVAHVHCYATNKTLCGLKRWQWPPYILNKTMYDAETMLKRHIAFAERRGGPNPYKYTCIKCENKLQKIVDGKIKENRMSKLDYELQIREAGFREKLMHEYAKSKKSDSRLKHLFKKKKMELNHRFIFGKYKGKLILDIAKKDLQYIEWCMENGHLRLTDEAKKQLKEL